MISSKFLSSYSIFHIQYPCHYMSYSIYFYQIPQIHSNPSIPLLLAIINQCLAIMKHFSMIFYHTTWANCLVVLTILKNMKVNGKDDIPYLMENKKCLKPHNMRKNVELAKSHRKYRNIPSVFTSNTVLPGIQIPEAGVTTHVLDAEITGLDNPDLWAPGWYPRKTAGWMFPKIPHLDPH